MTIVRVTAVAAWLLVSAVGALATDAPISGKTLVTITVVLDSGSLRYWGPLCL